MLVMTSDRKRLALSHVRQVNTRLKTSMIAFVWSYCRALFGRISGPCLVQFRSRVWFFFGALFGAVSEPERPPNKHQTEQQTSTKQSTKQASNRAPNRAPNKHQTEHQTSDLSLM